MTPLFANFEKNDGYSLVYQKGKCISGNKRYVGNPDNPL